MSQLIVTGDGDTTFFVYDLNKKELIFAKPKQSELNSNLIAQRRPPFRPFGISVSEDLIFIASNDRIGTFNKTTFEFIEILDIPVFTNTHQILSEDNYLFVCNTSNDSIGIHNLTTKESKFLKFPDCVISNKIAIPIDAYELDNVHVNSIHKNGELLYFCLHNKGISKFGFLNLETNQTEILFNAGVCSHNVRILDNKIYSLSSKTGHIIQLNLETKEELFYPIVDPKIVFLRGLEIYEDRLLIACSNYYDNGDPIVSYLISFDPKNNTMSPYMSIPEVKFITDIHLL